MDVDVRIQKQFIELFTADYQEYALWSGRGAGKSWAVADYLVLKALESKKRILCTREIQNSITDSVMKLLADRISYHKFDAYFDIQKSSIFCINGSEFIFKGLKHNINSIKSMEAINITWIEEAQTISHESLDILLPTIFRVQDAKIIYTYNPCYSTDAIYERFHGEEKPINSIVKQVSGDANKYFSDAMKAERDFNFKTDPEVANHIWNGALCPTSSAMSVLPLQWLRKAVGAHTKFNIRPEFNYAGFDIADTGEDHCALAYVTGPILQDVVEFDRNYISESVKFVDDWARDKNITRIYYDATGLGAGAKSDFNRITDRDYTVEPFLGAHSPEGKDKIFTDKITNGQYFRNKKAQSWWNLRLRLENTLRLLDGEQINPNRCLFINENIINLDKLLLELSQASYKHEESKLMVDKQPNDEASPNMADAIHMAFTRDLRGGIKARC